MDISTTRFGTVTIADDRLITLKGGLLGFPEMTRFCLLQPADDACFFWLQSADDPSLAFVVTDPTLFISDYQVPIREEQMAELALASVDDAQVFVIVNKVDGALTGNLQGPIVVNSISKQGEQMVLAEKKWSTRVPLMTVPQTRVAQPA